MASASSWRTLSATSPVSSMLRPTSGFGLLGLRMTSPPWPVARGMSRVAPRISSMLSAATTTLSPLCTEMSSSSSSFEISSKARS